MKTTFNYKRVYVWELPVRLFHWITVVTMLALIITGFLIANPPAIPISIEPVFTGTFALIRKIHFISAYVLIAATFFRLYWSLVGNRFANWRNFFPYTKKGLKNIFYVFKVDILLLRDKDHKLSNISIGHNYLASISYSIMMVFFWIQVVTGFAMYADMSTWWFPQLFAWITDSFSDIEIRYLHHLFTWIFISFVVVHVYLVLYHDYLEARGEASAMISGYKFVRAERLKEDEAEIISQSTSQMWSGASDEEILAKES